MRPQRLRRAAEPRERSSTSEGRRVRYRPSAWRASGSEAAILSALAVPVSVAGSRDGMGGALVQAPLAVFALGRSLGNRAPERRIHQSGRHQESAEAAMRR